MALTKAHCLARAALYEEAVEHICLVWDAPDMNVTESDLKFVEQHLRREIDRWESEAKVRT